MLILPVKSSQPAHQKSPISWHDEGCFLGMEHIFCQDSHYDGGGVGGGHQSWLLLSFLKSDSSTPHYAPSLAYSAALVQAWPGYLLGNDTRVKQNQNMSHQLPVLPSYQSPGHFLYFNFQLGGLSDGQQQMFGILIIIL